MKAIITKLIFFTLIVQYVVAQSLSKTPEIREFDKLDSLSRAYYNVDKNKAIQYAIKQLYLTKKIQNNELIGYSFHRLGYLYNEIKDYPEAVYHHLCSIDHKRKYADSIGIGESYVSLAISYFDSKQYQKAIQYSKRAITLLKIEPENKFLSTSYYYLTKAYSEMKDPSALSYLFISYNKAKSSNNLYQMALDMTYVSAVFRKMNLFDSAIKYDQLSYQIAAQIKDTVSLARALNNIGFNYYLKGETHKAIPYIKSSIDLKAPRELSNAYISLSDAYLKVNKIEDAKEALDHAWINGPKLADLANTTKSIADYYMKRNAFKEAAVYYNKNILLKDSIDKLSHLAKEENKKAMYEIENAEARHSNEIELENQQITDQALQDRYVFYTILSIVCVMISIYWGSQYFKEKIFMSKTNKKLENINKRMGEILLPFK